MLGGIKNKVMYWGEILFVVVITLVLFEHAIRPILIDIHPMFAGRYHPGRRFSTPAGVALLTTFIMLYVVYYILYDVLEAMVDSYISEQN